MIVLTRRRRGEKASEVKLPIYSGSVSEGSTFILEASHVRAEGTPVRWGVVPLKSIAVEEAMFRRAGEKRTSRI